MTHSNVRVRFAPSPTGYLHIGNLRAALYNWIFARHHKGTFCLRIEDTDLERSKEEYTQFLLEALEWTGIVSDEPLVYQSKRTHRYQEVIQYLLSTGACYWSDPSQEENGKSVVRFRVPRDRDEVIFHDIIRGEVRYPLAELNDFVIARCDGSPLYNFVVVVDDADMKISHIIRGEDHIPNTPRQILLYQACGWQPPFFAHLPLILGPSGAPLSKRDGTVSVLDYKKQGYLPDALCNYLLRLGWSYGDQEIFTRQDMIALFDVKNVHPSGAMFDPVKLAWTNAVYLRSYDADRLYNMLGDQLGFDIAQHLACWNHHQIKKLIEHYKERVHTLVELKEALVTLSYAPEYHTVSNDLGKEKDYQNYLEGVVCALREVTEWSENFIKDSLQKVCAEHGIKLGQVGMPLRVALTGGTASPSLFVVLEVLGKHESMARIENFLHYLTASKKG